MVANSKNFNSRPRPSSGGSKEDSTDSNNNNNVPGKPSSKPAGVRTEARIKSDIHTGIGAGAIHGNSNSKTNALAGSKQYQQGHLKQKNKSINRGSTTSASIPPDLFTEEDAPSTSAKVKKPKPSKVPIDPNEHISYRAFVRGLAKDVTLTELEGRFKSFGQPRDLYLAKDLDGSCRGFGYITLDTTRKELQKCLALFNGAKWKGNVLKIEEANKDWQTKRKEDLELQAKIEKKEQEALLKKWKRNPAKHAEDMSLITEKNMDGKRGWKRGRYGRPVITMKLDRMTYDPSHYKNNVEKLFNIAEKPLPFDQLIYRIDENEPKPKGKHLPTEVALASFLAKPKPTPITTNSNMDMAEKKKSAVQGRDIKTLSTDKTSGLQQSLDNVNIANDRAMMASVLAGLNMSPKALSLDDSDLDDNEDGGPYMESIDSSLLQETNIDDLFGDVVLDSPLTSKLSRAQRDSKPEDLFGEDEDEEETRTNQSPSDILEDNSKDEHDEDQDEEMESGEEEEDGVLDEDTIKTIAQLQSSSSTGIGGLFDSDDDNEHDRLSKGSPAIATKLAEESNNARLKALEAREAELEAVRERRQQLITSTLSNIDSREKKVGHVVFSDSGDDSYESEDYEKMEADHAKKMSNMGKPLKSIFNSDSGSEDEDRGQILTDKKKALKSTTKEMFASDDEDDDSGSNNLREPSLNIKEQFEGPSGRALFEMQTRIGTSDSRFQLTKDFLDDHIRGEDDVDFIAHQDRLNTGGIGADIEGIILDEDRQHESNVSAEKIQAMNVLRAMFGDAAVRNKKKEEDFARQAKGGLGYTTGLTVRYDPDADPSPPLSTLPSPPKTSTDSVHDFSRSVFDSESEEEQGEPQNYILDTNDSHHGQKQKEIESGNSMNSGTVEVQDAKQPKKAVGFSFAFDNDTLNHDNEVDNRSETSASPPPTNNKKDSEIKTQFQVATDLRSLFTPTSGTFTLFGNDHEEDEESHAQVENVEDDRMDGSLEEDRSRDQDEILTAYTDGSRTIFASGADALNSSGRTPLSHAGSLFFFHFKDPELLKRSNFKTNKVFMRTSSLEEINAHWEKTRHAMTQEFKRKHKSASRNKARASKRIKSNISGDQS